MLIWRHHHDNTSSFIHQIKSADLMFLTWTKLELWLPFPLQLLLQSLAHKHLNIHLSLCMWPLTLVQDYNGDSTKPLGRLQPSVLNWLWGSMVCMTVTVSFLLSEISNKARLTVVKATHKVFPHPLDDPVATSLKIKERVWMAKEVREDDDLCSTSKQHIYRYTS